MEAVLRVAFREEKGILHHHHPSINVLALSPRSTLHCICRCTSCSVVCRLQGATRIAPSHIHERFNARRTRPTLTFRELDHRSPWLYSPFLFDKSLSDERLRDVAQKGGVHYIRIRATRSCQVETMVKYGERPHYHSV